ncbi:alpha-1,6-mannosyl-glycoprotein 2-beta-N-acetylglucosaminyltransferase-like [Drosophila sulfurigaster albostrigata]|uniref:alpha-1,6-mannosyl-glycoprotein 2-beta-N-acetylglucosaminyltransferase-like n=1 Tax=Drosophila sulfurigaster albostrigata TaxID=89887 RepID=UPI002D21C58A|nr:alpha-1,6-mannosyl-glycoprotein 2-beta-N-acetylglucosaminyltransferase-like [Drosophila sulfurigaster albostrigata]
MRHNCNCYANDVETYQEQQQSSEELFFNEESIEKIKIHIISINKQQLVLNEEIYGPLTNDSVIVLIQVHKRIEYLEHLIYSLSLARNISQALLIFSHDYYDNVINDLVQSIKFCKVMQIFYPHSVQMHPNEFPGDDPNECSQQSSMEGNPLSKCNNVLHIANVTQMKHHWWWKANMVFNGLEITKHHKGLVLFLEEDHYVAEDFLHVLLLMQESRGNLCPDCNVLALGNYLKSLQYFTYHKKVEAEPWYVGKHNMGFAINRTLWTNINRCAKSFCNYNDYNWDWSLQHASSWCLKRQLLVMAIKGTRVFHIGNCGFHHSSDDCTSVNLITKVQLVLKSAREAHQLYPKFLRIVKPLLLKRNHLSTHFHSYGRWADPRDHQLCLNNTLPNR